MDDEELPSFKVKVKAEPVDLSAEPLPANIFEEDERAASAKAAAVSAIAKAARAAEVAKLAEAARVRAEQDRALAVLASGDNGASAAPATVANGSKGSGSKRAYTVEYHGTREAWIRPECRMCHMRPANALSLPCAHLGCCSVCSRKARFCFVCGSVVKTRVVVKN